MLRITIPAQELYDEGSQEFINTNEKTLEMEHSLVSLSKWESKWHKPFLGMTEKTTEEILDYVRCMTLTKNVDPSVYRFLTNNNLKEIQDYIDDSMTATTFSKHSGGNNREIITSEIIYYSMIALNIPFECQKWHLNRLITLIQVCTIKNQPPKKMSKSAIMNRNAAINAARKKRLNTKG